MECFLTCFLTRNRYFQKLGKNIGTFENASLHVEQGGKII